MKKSIPVALILLFVMLASLLACVRPAADQKPAQAPAKQAAPARPAQSAWDRTLAAARSEGKVTLYTSLGQQMRTVLGEGLQKNYGIELEMVSGRTLEVIAKMTAERRAGLYLADIYIGGASSQMTMKENGLIQPMEPAFMLPEVLDKKAWSDEEMLFIDRDRTILIFGQQVNTPIIVNKDMTAPVKNVRELLEPKWKGKFLMMDPTTSGAGNLFTLAAGEMHGEDFLRKLATQEPAIVRDYRTHVEWVARGKYALGTGPNPENVFEFLNAGAPLGLIVPDDLRYASSANALMSLVAQPGHPNAARVFVNYLLSKEGQTAFVKGTGTQSRRVDVTTEYTVKERIRQPGVKYFNTESEELALKRLYYQDLNKGIFGKFLK